LPNSEGDWKSSLYKEKGGAMSTDRDSHAINQSYQGDASGPPELEVLATALEKVHSIEEGLDELIKRVAQLEERIADAASKLEVRITKAESLLEEIAGKQD
jgi:hypothetical protein